MSWLRSKTTIVAVRNLTPYVVNFRNLESSPAVTASIGPDLEAPLNSPDDTIPWCGSQEDFPAHHIEIEVPDREVTYCIWQGDDKGDYVRCSIDGKFTNSEVGPEKTPAWTVPGGAETGEIYKAIIVFPCLLEFVRKPPTSLTSVQLPAAVRFG